VKSAPFRVGLVQMVSTPVVAENLDAAERLVAQAAAEGAELVALPEYFCILGMRDTDKVAAKEKDGAGPVQEFLAAAAKRHGIWLVGGSVPLECADPGKVRNSCLVYDSEGRRAARYDKIHLFGLDLGAERFEEGRTIEPGSTPCAIDSPFGRIAVSVCYDVRFPELYRALAPMDIILVPSAFTATTGRAHWEALLRARAIENLAWVLAPAQGGTHQNGRQTYGHTMVVDPWGKIVAERTTGAGVVIADIDPEFQANMRRSLPALTHRVLPVGRS
jgi:nitrilase